MINYIIKNIVPIAATILLLHCFFKYMILPELLKTKHWYNEYQQLLMLIRNAENKDALEHALSFYYQFSNKHKGIMDNDYYKATRFAIRMMQRKYHHITSVS